MFAETMPVLVAHDSYQMWVLIAGVVAQLVMTYLQSKKTEDLHSLVNSQRTEAIVTSEKIGYALGAIKGTEKVVVDPLTMATTTTATVAAMALVESARATAAALKMAAASLPVDTEIARQTATILRDTASAAAAKLLADVAQKDHTVIALAASVASDLLATAAQIAASLKGVAVVAATLTTPVAESPHVDPTLAAT